jgi:hypothetical protein
MAIEQSSFLYFGRCDGSAPKCIFNASCPCDAMHNKKHLFLPLVRAKHTQR